MKNVFQWGQDQGEGRKKPTIILRRSPLDKSELAKYEATIQSRPKD